MKKDDQAQPKPQPAGAKPPPRPPRRTAIGLGPDDDDSGQDQIEEGDGQNHLASQADSSPCGWTARKHEMIQQSTLSNKPAAPNSAITSQLHSGHRLRGVGEPER
jgi:hypothetical protein